MTLESAVCFSCILALYLTIHREVVLRSNSFYLLRGHLIISLILIYTFCTQDFGSIGVFHLGALVLILPIKKKNS